MTRAGSHNPRLDKIAGWSNPNHNFGSRGAKDQPSGKNQSNQSFREHCFPFFIPTSQTGAAKLHAKDAEYVKRLFPPLCGCSR